MAKRIFAAAIALLAALAVLPAAALAADGKIQAGLPALSVTSQAGLGSTIAFGGHEWYVIGDATRGVNPVAGNVTLLSKVLLPDSVKYRQYCTEDDYNALSETEKSAWQRYEHGVDNVGYYSVNPDGMSAWAAPAEYAGSAVQQRMAALAGASGLALGSLEQGLITARNITDGILGPAVNGQPFWLLSSAEMDIIDATNGTTNVLRDWESWWLRTNGSGWHVYYFNHDGLHNYYRQLNETNPLSNNVGDRPAFNLDVSDVLFVSSAEGGKAAAAAGGGFVSAVTPDGTLKLTVTDDSRGFSASAASFSGNTLTIEYSGATPYDATDAPNEYVSAILCDAAGNVTHYAKLARPASGSGSADLDFTGIDITGKTLRVFSEQANGGLYTDFASAPVLVALPEGFSPTSAVPETGDGSLTGLWLGLLLLAGCGLALFARRRRA